MLLFLFLLPNHFVTVIADRNETNGNFSNKKNNRLIDTTEYYKSSQTKE